MKQKLSEKEKEILSETPEEAIERILFWKDFKPEFRAVKSISAPNKALDQMQDSCGWRE